MVRLNRQEVIQKLQQPVRLFPFRTVSRNGKQHRLRIAAQDGKFIDQGGVEHDIRTLLERENIILFPPPHARPHGDRIPCRIAARPLVTDDPAQKPSVCRRDPVVLIYVQLRQGGDINLEFALRRKRISEGVIDSVNSFYDQNLLRLQLQMSAFVFSLPCNKIEGRQLNVSALQKLRHAAGEQPGIYGLQTFKIITSVFVFRRIFPVLKEVVHRDRMRFQPVDGKLGGKPVAECGLAGRGRTRDQNHPALPVFGDLFRDSGHLPLMQRFLGENQFFCLSRGDQIVQVADRIDVHEFSPEPGVVLHMEKLHDGIKGRNLIRIFPGGKLKNKAILKELEIEEIQIRSIRNHITVIVIFVSVEGVYIGAGIDSVAEEFRLIQHVCSAEKFYGRIRIHTLFQNRISAVPEPYHLLLQIVQEFLRNLPPHCTEEAV